MDIMMILYHHNDVYVIYISEHITISEIDVLIYLYIFYIFLHVYHQIFYYYYIIILQDNNIPILLYKYIKYIFVK